MELKNNSIPSAETNDDSSTKADVTTSSPNNAKPYVVRSFYLSERNLIKLRFIYNFCNLYNAHRNFDLAKRVAKNKPLNWEQAESLSKFCNQIVTTKESKPQDFISDDDTNSNEAIIKYLSLKHRIKQTKLLYGVKNTNELYKSVKKFYRKKMYCYEMDSYFTWLIDGLYKHKIGFFSYDEFKENYCFEVSLFTGKKSPIKIKKAIKISQYILSC